MARMRRKTGTRDDECNAEEPTEDGPVVYAGGQFKPLSDHETTAIINNAFSILDRIGLGGAPEWLCRKLEEKGARLRSDGRITFPRALVEDTIGRATRTVNLRGFHRTHDLVIGGGNVHIGTGGAAVRVLDATTNTYRDSNLADLYSMMRVLDACPNVHYGVRPLIARNMESSFDLDINTAYACLRATTKPIGVSFHTADHVEPVVKLFDLALGREGGFRTQPFCMAIVVHVVPPLQFAEEGMEILRAAIDAGMPLQICSAGQAGATSPASLAGALAQGLAESLAGMMVVDALKPGHPCIYAFMPFISDLRTGAMSGGSGEAAIASAAAAQLLLHLGLPSTACAGMTDSKIADAQAGYEKGYTVALVAQAGADMINLSVGMLGSIMVASPEALVIDDEMCGAILRTVRGIEVSDAMLDLDAMERVVTGEGHYLGEPQTLGLMKSEYVYPNLGNRNSVDDWIETGRKSVWDNACERVKDILHNSEPDHLSKAADQAVRDRFPIHLEQGG